MKQKVQGEEHKAIFKSRPKRIKQYLFKPNIFPAKGRGGEYGVIVNLNTGLYYTVNRTGEKIWELIDGKRTVNAIAAMTARRFSVSKKRIAGDVVGILKTFETAGLIRWQPEK